jgi:hypothetical protein
LYDLLKEKNEIRQKAKTRRENDEEVDRFSALLGTVVTEGSKNKRKQNGSAHVFECLCASLEERQTSAHPQRTKKKER